MSSAINQPPIYIYANPGKFNDHRAAVNSTCIQENLDRLTEYKIDPDRILVLKTNEELKKALKIHQKAILIIPGGNTYHLASCLRDLYGDIRKAAENGLNIWGQCAGANILCEQNNLFTAPLGLLPLKSITLPTKSECRVAKLTDEKQQEFTSFWYKGPYFEEILSPTLFYNPITYHRLASYNDINDNPIAIFGMTFEARSVTIIVSGAHPEIVKEEVPKEKADFASDKIRSEVLTKIYTLLGIL